MLKINIFNFLTFKDRSIPNFKIQDSLKDKFQRKVLKGKLMKILNSSLIKEEEQEEDINNIVNQMYNFSVI